MVSLLTRRMACVVALLATAATADAQSKRPMTIMDIMDLKNVGGVSLSPDGSKVAYAVSTWEHPSARSSADSTKPDTAKGDKHEMRSHIWMVPAGGGTPRQLTFSERGENGPQWSPDGRSLAFVSSRGSGTDAKTQIWILPMDGGEAYQLTTSKENVTGFEWSKDGSRIAFLAVDTLPKTDEAKTARRDDPQVFEDNFRLSHAWVIDVATKRATEVAHGNLTVAGAPSWSPDGTHLAFQAAPTTMIRDTRSDIYVVTIADKSMKKITAKPEAGSAPAWSPDGKTIAFTCFRRVTRLAPTASWIARSATTISFSMTSRPEKRRTRTTRRWTSRPARRAGRLMARACCSRRASARGPRCTRTTSRPTS